MEIANDAVVAPLAMMVDDPDDVARILDAPPPVVQLLPLAAYACDVGGRIRWFNPRAVALWGRAPRTGEHAERFCGACRTYRDDGARIRHEDTAMASVLATGEPVYGEVVRLEHSDGSRIKVTHYIDPIRDRRGTLLGAISCFHEAPDSLPTEARLRELEKRVEQSEERFRQLLDALPAAIYTTDVEGKITYYNQAAADLAGRNPEIGKDEWCVTWRLYTPDGAALPFDQCPMAIALRENRPVRGVEALAERPDGTRIPLMPYPTPLRDAAGNLTGAVNMLVDVSERVRAEARQKMLLDEVNHRVKNNMQMLHSLLRAAYQDTQSPEARGVLADASQRIGAMAAAQQVLYNTDNPTHFSARGFLDAVCAAAGQSLGKTVTVTVENASGDLINAVAMPLALILNELLVNAAKHGVDGRSEGSIGVGLTRQSRGFELYVQDDGPGFDLEGTRYRSGLRLVTGLVQQLHGAFAVERMAGARCTVRFPDVGAPQPMPA